MTRALFLSLPLHGHTNPSLALVGELARRGDEIVYYSNDTFAERIEQSAARYRRYRTAFLADMKHLPERLDEMSWLLMRTTAEVLDNELDAFRAERPDYVITDSVAPWGHWVAQALGVPAVTSISTFAFNRHVLAFGMTHGVGPKSVRLMVSKMRHMAKALLLQRRLTRRYGVRGPGLMGSMFGWSALNIVYTSRHFQPCAATFDDRFKFVGPSMTHRTGTVDFPWEEARHRVIVYVSLGTVFNTDAAFYRHCFEAFRDEDFQVIMSLGSSLAPERVGQPPPNFIVRAQVPQLEVLPRASVFVTHGGMNSVCESLYHGVPLVVIPQMSEQQFVGRRVEELGAGLYVAKERATPEALRAAVRRLLTEDRFHQQAQQVRESFQSAGGVARAADAIMTFTR